ncbi:M28 family metallopeptidase [Rufibacter latericius]|uniref:M20/M25/M40 family metallo-hydrolase n=1 Tax=Rufibacter latericius TaxID=2487040 RepID=A0A3M9ML71_9BACT|nr:M20/M25/M40 family metallo-hydrolase [Rufibacter latericius]RNI26300.1 M20/M25/M40 family metallo-hydrolase [Rufibacter latericius]
MMTFTRWLSFLLLLISVTANAQDLARVRQTISDLSAPALHGRGYAFKGDSLAANYLQKQFESIGLRSFTPNYKQSFTLPVNILENRLQLEIDGKALVPGVDFIAHAATGAGSGEGRVYDIDTLILKDVDVAQQFLTNNLRNKVLVVYQRHLQELLSLPEPFQPQLKSVAAVIVRQPGPKLMGTVRGEQLPFPVLEVLEKSWPKKAKKVTFAVDARLEPQYQSQNIIGFVPGKVKPDSFVVVTAHYDHLGHQGKSLYFPGAHDNASGTAMLLELARHYAQPQNAPDFSIAFMAFAGEEAGLVGSRFYTENPLFPLNKIKFLLNLDLMSTGEEGMMVVNGSVYPKQFALLQSLNQQHGYLSQIKSRGKAANSDHYFFSEKGVPAFFFYTLGGTTTEYHHPNDKAETLPLTKFKEVMALIQGFIKAL